MNEMLKLIEQINQIGQSLWYDNIERKLLQDGTLAGMVSRGEIRGITSNPSIFNKAITQSADYDLAIQELTLQGSSREEIYENLAVRDIQSASDLFAPLYKETGGADGYVSLEVDPTLARKTGETISEAIKIWGLVDRPNLMVKIPATLEGLPAITAAIAEGINVNVTLIFGLDRYQKVIDAYLAGLEERAARGKTLSSIASVASFFISRIDSKVDQQLGILSEDGPAEQREMVKGLLGKAALASGKLAFELYQENFSPSAPRYQALADQGANPQRALWASTSTKNPAYPDTYYVDGLVGPGTVNTIPPKTLKAFLDHGMADLTITQDLESARETVKKLADLGIDLEQVAVELETEGVQAFSDAYLSLLDSIANRMDEFKR
jgi:transaldolase